MKKKEFETEDLKETLLEGSTEIDGASLLAQLFSDKDEAKDDNENTDEQELIEDATDADVDSSLNLAVNSKDKEGQAFKRLTKRTKKTLTEQAEEVVNNYLKTRGNKEWTALQEFFWYGIKQFAFKFMHNWDDAYDMTIETFISAMNNIESYNPEKARFSTWLWTICKNNCIHLIKERKRIPLIDNDISDLYDSTMLAKAFAPSIGEFKICQNNLEEIKYDDISDDMYRISLEEINRMRGIGKDILEMKIMQNKKIREIADELQMNESTVKNYLYKTKTNLCRIIQRKHKALYDIYIDMRAEKENAFGI